jgi:PAS domain S-box-containing protein
MFIEELQYENLELRRKEQILQSIPDLIVVFDSSGCISFASPSVSTFINYKSDELEETCFWDVLTQESKRMVKSAFIDALSVNRDNNVDSTPLCRGDSITIKFLGKKTDEEDEEGYDISTNSNKMIQSFSLKGVINFTGELPECVCSIRSEDAAAATHIAKEEEVKNISRSNTALSSYESEEAIQQQRRIEVDVTMRKECDALSSEVSDFDSDRDISYVNCRTGKV